MSHDMLNLRRQLTPNDSSCCVSAYLLFWQTGRPYLPKLSCLVHCRIMDTSSHSSQNPGTFSYAAPELILNGKLDVKVMLGPGMICNALRCHRQEFPSVPLASMRQAAQACGRLLLLLRAILFSACRRPTAQHPGAACMSPEMSTGFWISIQGT